MAAHCLQLIDEPFAADPHSFAPNVNLLDRPNGLRLDQLHHPAIIRREIE